MKKRILSILLTLVMVIGMLPTVAFAAGTSGGGITLSGDLSDWNIKISDAGVLSWDAQASATKYELEFYENPADAYPEVFIGDLTTNSCDLKAAFEAKKIEHDGFNLSINALNGTTTIRTTESAAGDPDIGVWYVSSLPKLSEPHNLTWDGYTAKWDSVPNATGYKVTLYYNNYAQKVSDVTSTEFNYEGSGVLPKAGWWFEVEATRDGYRNSNAAESPKYGEEVVTPPAPTEIDSIHIEGIPAPQYGMGVKEYDDNVVEAKIKNGSITVNGQVGIDEDFGNICSDGARTYHKDESIFDNVPEYYYTAKFEEDTYYLGFWFTPATGYTFADDLSATVDGVNNADVSIKDAGDDWIVVWIKYEITAPSSAPTEYDITVNGGTASVGAGTAVTKATAGTEITLTANAAPAGKVFDKWVVTGASVADATAATTTFTMPASNVTAAATYKNANTGGSGGGGGSVATYAIVVEDSDNGEISASKKYASKGTDITLTVKADEGYELDTLKVFDKDGDKVKVTKKGDKYTFEMPASKVTVTATFAKIEVEPTFDDVAEDAYYFDAVEWAVEEGITSGTSATTFSPNATCTRAQAVTFLWRAAGSPEPKSTEMPFEDVAADAYYYDAVLWAVENGITAGTSATTFSPNNDCTRAQIVTFLWRSEKSPAADSVNPFTDVAAEAYYFDAVLWAVENGVTAGTTATTFSPNNDCTRAQIVTFLYRALSK